MPKRVPARRGPDHDDELTWLPEASAWRCPGCGHTFRVFYGTPPHRRCHDCWLADHPHDPHTKRLAEP